MSNLLIFFALPLATIIIAIVLERIWKNYILVTLFTFAVYLIVAFALGDANLLVLVIIYSLLAFIAAFLSMIFRKICKKLRKLEEVGGVNDENENNEMQCHHRKLSEVGNARGSNNCNNTGNIGDCKCNRNNSQNLAINATVTPNQCNNGRTGTFRGQYRRRF